MKDSFSLFELNQHLRRIVSFNMREPLWIRCEISDMNFNRGYVYLSLVDRDEQRVLAKASAMIRPRELEQIKKSLGDSIWSILQAGQQVLLNISVEYSELYGMTLSVKEIEASFTIGQLELQRISTLKRLEDEQFFDLNRQLDLPVVPQRIAVISSKEAAGLQDFLQHLHNNPHHFKFETELFQAAVQGVNVPIEVVQQIEIIESQSKKFDCIVIVRGGGAKLDLMGFNDFEVCKAIATSELPVITGIGHDIDETLADLVAHSSMKTPTAVADFLIQRIMNFEIQLNRISFELHQIVNRKINNETIRVDSFQKNLSFALKTFFQYEWTNLDIQENKLDSLLPENYLRRGFAMIYNEQRMPISTIDNMKEGDNLLIKLSDAEIVVKTITIKKI